jgi:glyoxylase-like metal-dependent hydrolase (beta-lactamase superfamily II)
VRDDAGVKIEMLNVGWMTAPAGLWRGGDDLERPSRVPVPAYLIETGAERILIDTGLNPDAVADPEGHYGAGTSIGFFELEQEHSIADLVDLATVTMVVLTHLHFDHAGGLALLPDSVPVFVQRTEWEAGADPEAIARNFFLPRDYAGGPADLRLIDGDHDLLGDGSIELLFTPGHTPGHQSVRVGEDLVLGIDVAHFDSTLDDRRFPAFGDDREEQGRSAARLRELRDAGARIVPGHDPEVLRPGPVIA